MESELVLRVGLDADGVIFDGAEMKSRMTYEMFGLYIPPENYCKRRVLGSGLVSCEQYSAMKTLAYNTDVALTFKFVADAEEVIRQMIIQNWFLPVLTNRKESAANYIRQIFVHHKLDLQIFSNGDTQLCENGQYFDNSKLNLITDFGGASRLC